ncbi:hypothetical protein TcCL_NonESM09061 [Trypanosoma cruzi]|nr:hypothetical protein TcCL_NonESM09061 [Trypanosoma cruzi]
MTKDKFYWGNGAFRVAAWSEAPRHGWMRIRFRVWLFESSIRVRCVPAAGCGRMPLAVGLNWRRWRWVTSSPCPLVCGCWRCVRLLCGGRLAVYADSEAQLL